MPLSYSRAEPVDPQATPEARALLARLQEVNGHRTLSGHHNYLSARPLATDRITTLTGRIPLVWGGEWGFSDANHPTDDVSHRPALLEEIRVRHEEGHIIVLTWHQASPAVGEPCPFEGGVKCAVSEAQWREILRPDSALNRVWRVHVDRLAAGLTRLQAQRIPVIFRPYHEMNGDWFWWGARPGPADYTALWRMLQARLTGHHGLHNLLWAWCCDRPWEGVEAYWPGHDCVDILGTDIYPLPDHPVVYRPEWFPRMQTLAAGKPLALTEHSVMPTAEELSQQPWTWCMGWVDLPFSANPPETIRDFYRNPQVESL